MINKKNIKKDVNYVMARKNRHHGLLPMKEALKEIGRPEEKLRIIHFAGTNGKGSTLNYVKDILMSSGYKVATFTSPHLISHFDRICINNEWIKESSFNYYLKKFEKIIEKYDLGMFEIDLLIALAYFSYQKVDYVLLETGLGGRLDNTNVIDNTILEVITSIGIDHQDILGDKLEQIAFEKAGIIKKNTTVIIGAKINKKAKKIIYKKARYEKANVLETKYFKTGSHSFIFKDNEYEIKGGSYQKRNAALALNVAWALGIDIKEDIIKKAIKDSLWAGRFETINDKPLIVIDGAHNMDGLKALLEASDYLAKPIITIFASLKDKPGIAMVNQLKKVSQKVIITEFDNPRIRHIDEYDDISEYKYLDYKQAINESIEEINDGSILITGSLYFISIVREFLLNKDM